MKSIPYFIIVALIIIILAMLFFKGNRKDIINTRAKYDSAIRPHLSKIAQLEKSVSITKHDIVIAKQKAKIDSISYKKTLSRLIKERDAARYRGVPAQVSDDSVQIAMDCLEKQPYYDSISTVRENRIVELEEEKAELVKDYESIMDDNQSEKNELQAIIDLKDKEIGELTKLARKANRKAKLRLIEGVGLGVLGGLAIGGLK